MAKTALQKGWYEIVSPDLFGSETVAETPAGESDLVVGRTVKVNLQDLMPSSDKYYMDVFLQVTEVEGDTARTRIAGHTVASEHISRMVSRRSNRIDAVVDAETVDGETVRVKVVGTTIRKTNSSKAKAIRESIQDVIEERASERDLDAFMEEIFTGSLQDALREEARLIYPVRDIEVRKTEVQ